jgi:type I restriction enzyme R subunit
MMSSERYLEEKFIDKLVSQKYIYRSDICERAALEKNFREKFQSLNRVNLTDNEFQRLLDELITPDVFNASRALRQINDFTRDDGTPLNYTLVNIKDWCKNHFEVINQLRINTDYSHHRYDVILLINGVPVVQVELKTLGVNPRRAMEQIVEYKNDPGNGYTRTLLCFIQLFIVSNYSDTWYFANNNSRHFSFNADERFLPIYQFASDDNKKITHLDSFAESFLPKCTLGQMISRYMVLIASEQKLLMMRPYQIYAVKAIVDCIHQNCGNGYIWHTTGSGKTLTSFKASTLLKDNIEVDKCIFVVDRKDLDRQTREEFNKFQEGCVEENTNTETLVRRLLSEDYADKVIVTTIQKLGLALDEDSKRNRQKEKQNRETFKQRLEPLRAKRMIFIFDECHRSQFGENHKVIKEFFPNSQLFGFTGTPIFEENATYKQVEGELASFLTTQDLFERELHAYTITHAIEDQNVLRFHVDYYKGEGSSMVGGASSSLSPVLEQDAPATFFKKQAIAEAIVAKHDAATGNRRFNAIFATASINDAIEYYELFKTVQEAKKTADRDFVPLNIACVFSPPAEGDKDVKQLQEDLPQESLEYTIRVGEDEEKKRKENERKKAALNAIISDYNTRYGANHVITEFDLYYQDVQKRIKDQQYPNQDLPHKKKIDLVIVVDMLLTGFDSKYLNTLYVDKTLKHHGLIQAFSRTNRILNATKPYGNILDFRQQSDAVDAAIAMFSGVKADRAREIWLVDKAPKVIEKLDCAVHGLEEFMKSQGLTCAAEDVPNLRGDDARVQFIKCFKEVQRLKTQLDQYTDLTQEDKVTIEQILPKDELNAFRGVYLETAQRLKTRQIDWGMLREESDEYDVNQLDFEFVLFASAVIDYDYIMDLIARYSQEAPGKQKMTRDELIGLIQSDAKFMDERAIITDYVRSLKEGEGLGETAIRDGYQRFKDERNAAELAAFAAKHGLPADALQAFADNILQRMIFDGEQLTDLMEPLELSWKERRVKELALMEDLVPLLNKRAQGRNISGLSAYEQN